jgi:alanine-glyoxylate transaminase/serine-glyoxylate transaminase/serine-pyruvate transaminase
MSQADCLSSTAYTFQRAVMTPKVRSSLINDFNIEIGAGLGDLAGKIWRIGLMGHTSRKENVELCLKALKDVL